MKRILTLAFASMAIQYSALGDGTGGEGGAGGQGGAATPEFVNTDEFKNAVASAVDAQVAGLKANRQSAFDQLAQVKGELAKFNGLDPEAVSNLMSRFESQEEQELFKQGKLESIVDRRVDKMRSQFDTTLADKDKILQDSLARQASLESRAIAAEITKAATEAGAIPTALTDFVQRSRGNFALTEKGDVIAVDSEGNPVFDVDGKTPLSAKAWAASLQAEAPHLFSKPASGGAQGGHGGLPVGKIDGTAAEREAYFQYKFKLPK